MARQISLYEIPKILETAEVLDSSKLNEYNESVKSNYNSKKARDVLTQFGEYEKELAGSNPFMLVHLENSGLLPQGARLAERTDLEKAISSDNTFLKENYVDIGLAIKTESDSYQPNDLIARKLAGQLKQRGIQLADGKLVSYNLLSLEEDDNSQYGLVFVLKQDANKDSILCINDFNWDYSREEGISRAYLNADRDWVSRYRDLADSNGTGRVVSISAEGTSQKFLEEHLAKLQKIKEEEIAGIKERYARAEAILRGK